MTDVEAAETGSGDWQPTACILCECNCGIEVRTDAGAISRIRGDKAHPGSQGYTCEKPLRLDRYQNGPHRLTSPMRRRPDGTFEEVDWDTAIAEVAARLLDVRDTFGGPSIFYYGGGGQGNHLCPGYGSSIHRVLGGLYHSSALAQEKTGEFWVDGLMYGGHTRGDFENTQCAVFVGKNPWQSHGVARARPTLNAIANDPDRMMIVIDPRKSETAELADIHLAVTPGTDAWCLAAMLGVLVQEDLIDHDFLDRHTTGVESVIAAFAEIPVDDYAVISGLEPDLLRYAARTIAAAESAAFYEDLGIQQSPNSTLCSYLEKLIWILTGNFAKRGGVFIHTSLVDITGGGADRGRTPVAGDRMISGLVPCNTICDEILTDHPERYRAMIIESSNPAHSLPGSSRWREALAALEFVVVIDVAMSETARCADYVFPASSQFEKWEATFFNFEFPHNVFQLRAPLFEPLAGTLPEPEMHSRLLRELGLVNDGVRERLSAALAEGRGSFAAALMAELADPVVAHAVPVLLYDVLGPTLPGDRSQAAILWAVAHDTAGRIPDSVRRAGIEGDGFELGEALFDALLYSQHGLVFSADEFADGWSHVATADGLIHPMIDELLAMVPGLADGPTRYTTDEFPLVLSAGERRSSTANTIYRDPTWRKRDPNGSLRLSPSDAELYGIVDGSAVRVVTSAGSAKALAEVTEVMRPGHISLPNGFGLDRHDDSEPVGVSPNELTTTSHRDPIVGTPYHKHTPARLEPIP